MRRIHSATVSFSFALTLGALVGCGSSSDDDDAIALIGTDETPAEDAPVDFGDPAGLDGLWDANTVSGLPVPPGTFYFFFDTTAPGEVSAIFFSLEAARNCLRDNSGSLTLIAPGVYEDEVGDLANVTLAGDTLDVVLDSALQGMLEISFDRVVNLSLEDLPVCAGKNDTATSPGLVGQIVQN